MSIGYDDPNAPPLDDQDIPFGPGHAGAQPTILLAKAIARLADSIDHLAVASQARGLPQTSPGGPPAAPSPPSGAPGPPGGSNDREKTTQEKRGGLIWGIAKDHGVTVMAAAESAGRNPTDKDARKWSDADQLAVIDAMKRWNWIEDKR